MSNALEQQRYFRREDARAELGRRRNNLRGAVIPAWEKQQRGERPDEWDLIR